MAGASAGSYFGTPALYGLMKKVEMPEADNRDVDLGDSAGDMPTVGGLSAWIAVNAFGEVLAGQGAGLDNVTPSNLTPVDRDEHEAILCARKFAMEARVTYNT